MSMMYLRFPRTQGFFSWAEIGLMARALGFAAETFSKCLPEGLEEEEEGLKTKAFLNMLNEQKYFHIAINCSFNIHTDEWNVCVINKAIALLDGRILSFEELHAVRVAFQVYEGGDTKGMFIDDKVLQRALKMCGRMISPMKMMHRIKHMKDEFQEEGRIQLHEFLDLLLWCDPYVGPDLDPKPEDLTRNSLDIFDVVDFEQVLQHYDERLAQRLNKEYLQDEWVFSKEKHGSKPLPKDVPPVDPLVREKMVQYHNDRYKSLHYEVAESQARVHRAQAGLVRDRPVQSPDLLMFQGVAPSQMAVSTLASIRPTVMETYGNLICPSRNASRARTEIPDAVFRRPILSEFHRPDTGEIVPKHDFDESANNVEALKFEMETLGMKYTQHLNEELDFMMPGYRGKRSSRQSIAADEAPAPCMLHSGPKRKEVREKPAAENPLDRLAAQPHRTPAPLHGKSCDARLRGWDEVNKRVGGHSVLVAPSYDNSERGKLFTKMYQKCLDTGNRTEWVYRYHKPEMMAEGVKSKKGVERPTPAELPSVDSEKHKQREGRRSLHRLSLVGGPPKSMSPRKSLARMSMQMDSPFCTWTLMPTPSSESAVLQSTSKKAFYRLCERAVDAGSHTLYKKLIGL